MLTTEFMDKKAAINYDQAAGGVVGILNGAKLVVGTNLLTPNKRSALADITQSPDANLAPIALTWSAAVRDGSNDIVIVSQLVHLQLALNANACVLQCWGIVDAGGTNLLMCGNLPTAINLPDNVAAADIVIPFAPGAPQAKDPIINP